MTGEEKYPLKEVTEKIIGCAFAVHNELGSGFVERAYENALAFELDENALPVVQQKPISVSYEGKVVGDFIGRHSFFCLDTKERIKEKVKAAEKTVKNLSVPLKQIKYILFPMRSGDEYLFLDVPLRNFSNAVFSECRIQDRSQLE